MLRTMDGSLDEAVVVGVAVMCPTFPVAGMVTDGYMNVAEAEPEEESARKEVGMDWGVCGRLFASSPEGGCTSIVGSAGAVLPTRGSS